MPRTTPEPQNEVGKNLRSLIGEDSVNAWANRHRLSQTTINRIVTGKMDPTVSTLEKIADAIGEEPWRLLAPSMGRSPVSFDRLSPDQAMLVTVFEFLTDEDQRELLMSVKARARASHKPPQTDEATGAREVVPSDREHKKNATESDQWHSSTNPITKTDFSHGRASPVTRDTEDKDHPKTRPGRRKGV